MYGSTYIIYFKIYNYLKMYKKPQTIHIIKILKSLYHLYTNKVI